MWQPPLSPTPRPSFTQQFSLKKALADSYHPSLAKRTIHCELFTKKKKIPTFLVFFWLTHLRGASSSHQLLLLLAVAQAEDSGKLGPGLTSGCAAVQRVRISWSQQWPPPSRRSYKSQAVPRPDQALLGTEGQDALGGRIGRSSRGTESVSASLCSSPSPAVHLVPHPLHLLSPLPSSSSAAANVATIQNIPSPSQLLL